MAVVVECPECGATFEPPPGAVLAGSAWMSCPTCFGRPAPSPPPDSAPAPAGETPE